jgi:hypothetical protein
MLPPVFDVTHFYGTANLFRIWIQIRFRIRIRMLIRIRNVYICSGSESDQKFSVGKKV